MDELLRKMDEKVSEGLEPIAFWIVTRQVVAELRFSNGTSVGPLAYGTYWGPGADLDLSAKLAGRLYRWGLMRGADTVEEAARMLRDDCLDGCINQVFPGDFPAELMD